MIYLAFDKVLSSSYLLHILLSSLIVSWANLADLKLVIFFLIFPRKQDLTFHANCLHWRQFAWNAKSCFHWRQFAWNAKSCFHWRQFAWNAKSCFHWRPFAWNAKSSFLGKLKNIDHQFFVCWTGLQSFLPDNSVTEQIYKTGHV